MRLFSKGLIGFFVLSFLVALLPVDAIPPPNPNMKLIAGMGSLHHPVSTSNAEAQRFFDQGLTYTYAFNHDGAYWSFQKAAELDPQLAMAYWGMALVLGPNLNKPDALEDEHKAYELIQKALKLAPNASPTEQRYIEALATRYINSSTPNYAQLNQAYATAMKQLSEKYPDDLDAATLYAESLMDIHPWALWSNDGKPTEGTVEIVNVLEWVLKRDPNHVGANHYYIHAIEASPHPEYALMSAYRLESLVPAAGHLIHMPAHIFLRIGDYPAVIDSNLNAIKVDQDYIKEFGMLGSYSAHYMGHNIDMLGRAYGMVGQYQQAKQAADDQAALYAPYHRIMPELEFRMDAPSILVLLRFHRWNEILQLPKPDPLFATTTAIWLGARGIAYAETGQVAAAIKEQKAFQELIAKIPDTAMFGLNKAQKVLEIMSNLLAARLAEAQHDDQRAVDFLQKAVVEQDGLAYDEPADWFYPIRESLGGQLLKMQRYQEAEAVFRKSLDQDPRNGRALFGLLEAMKGQHRDNETYWVQQEYEKAWKRADTPLKISDL